MTFFILLATGILLSLPVGPMGFTGSTQAADGHWSSARLLALGVCLGDGILVTFAIWGTVLPLETLKYVNLVILPCLAIYLWRKSTHVVVSPSGQTSLLIGLVSTSLHPGNFLAFTLSFRWLHDNGFVLHSLAEKILLTPAVMLAAMFVWSVFLLRSRRLSDSTMFHRWRPLAFRTVSVVCVGLAMMQATELPSPF
ncbi:MAG: hypothetical protein DI585_00855 [Pseudomonas fluorescens]|nr:MAG: hypothetical protein DI585_00855 [Pseudomonas fluorescens]